MKDGGPAEAFRSKEIRTTELRFSKTNPRLDASEGLETLVESVSRLGVLEPILVRPNPVEEGSYEILAGERRTRAALAAKITHVPARIVEVDDATAHEIQLVENIQRVDLSAAEEARGLRLLQSECGYSIEQLCEVTGKKRSAVFARLRLGEMADQVLEAIHREGVPASIAELLATIPTEELQKKALRAYVEDREEGQPMSVREFAGMIGVEFRLDLEGAPFDLEECQACPLNTACNADLAATGPDEARRSWVGRKGPAALCTSPECWDRKATAHAQEVLEAAQAKGREVLSAEEVAKAFRTRNVDADDGRQSVEWNSPYVDLDDRADRLSNSRKKVRGVLREAKADVPVFVAVDPAGHPHELVLRKDFDRVRRQQAGGKAAPAAEKAPSEGETRRLARAAFAAGTVAVVQYLAAGVAARAGKGGNVGLWRAVLETVAPAAKFEALTAAARVRGFDGRPIDAYDFLEQHAQGAEDPADLLQLAFELVLWDACGDPGGAETSLGTELGIDIATVRERAEDEVRAAAKTKRGAKKKAASGT